MAPSTNPSTRMKKDDIYLSQDDVERLMREDSPDARINVLDKISTNYAQHQFNPREYEYAEQIFRLLMRDTELRVRQRLADQIKDITDIPRDVVLHLAEDIEQVSLPVLRASQVLSDADLIRIVETSKEIGKLVAVAERDKVSTRVSHALTETHYPQVVSTLLENQQAEIADKTYNQIITEFQHEETVTTAMASRPQLPVAVAEKLIKYVSDSLAEELERRYQFSAGAIEQETREHVTLDLLSQQTSEEEIDYVVEQMRTDGRLTPSIILSSLCRGYLRFFEAALARQANIPKINARKLIHDKGPLGFHALYLKTGLPESMFEAVRLLLKVVIALDEKSSGFGAKQYANQVVKLLLEESQGADINNIPYIIALVRQSASH